MQNLSELVRRLIDADVKFVLVGGFAAVSHGVPLVTRDIDVCCQFDEANLMRIQKAFNDLHPVHRSRPDLPLDVETEKSRGLRNLYLKTDIGIVDCLGEVKGIGNFDEVFKDSVEVNLPAGKCRILDLDALIRAKEAMHRDHDLITVKYLKAIKERKSDHQSTK